MAAAMGHASFATCVSVSGRPAAPRTTARIAWATYRLSRAAGSCPVAVRESILSESMVDGLSRGARFRVTFPGDGGSS